MFADFLLCTACVCCRGLLQVSAEMIKELGLSDEELGQISLTITNLAEKARRRRNPRTFSSSSGLVGQVSEHEYRCECSMVHVGGVEVVFVECFCPRWNLASSNGLTFSNVKVP